MYTVTLQVSTGSIVTMFVITKSVTVQTLISRRGSTARLDEKYTLKDRFQNRVYVFKASGVRSDEKIYIERLIRKSCL